MSQIAPFVDLMEFGQPSPYVVERKAGGDLVAMFDTVKPACELAIPSTATFIIARNMGPAIRHSSDLGDGYVRYIDPPGGCILRRPNVGAHFRFHNHHHVRLFAWPMSWVLDAIAGASDRPIAADAGLTWGLPLMSSNLHALLDILWTESGEGTAASLLTAEGISLGLLAELLRLAQQPVSASRGQLPPWAVKRCIDYVQANLDREVAIAELAALVDLSSFHFARAFRVTTGKGPGAYQREARLKRAAELLTDTQMSIGEIATAIGYRTPQAFSRVFRRATGRTASSWRNHRSG